MVGKRDKSRHKSTAAAPLEGAGKPSGVPIWVISLIVAIPIVVVALFWQFSSSFNIEAGAPVAEAGSGKGHSSEELQKMAATLAAKLEGNPDDVQGMATLARTYYSMEDYPNAVKVFARLVKLIPDDATILADYADALAVANGNSLAGEPMALIERALKADPTYWKALAMSATDEFRRKDYAAAVAHWEKAIAGLPPGTEDLRKSIEGSLAQARELAAKP